MLNNNDNITFSLAGKIGGRAGVVWGLEVCVCVVGGGGGVSGREGTGRDT